MSMKMAKASAQDLDAAMSIAQALESISGQWFSTMPEAIEKPHRDDESERFDIDDPEHCRRVIEHLQQLTRSASLFRVVMGMQTVLSPRNKCVDPDADTIEHHPAALAGLKASQAKPLDEWNEENSYVLWWKFPINEPPYVGSPLCEDWPGYHTHWTPLIVPAEPSMAAT